MLAKTDINQIRFVVDWTLTIILLRVTHQADRTVRCILWCTDTPRRCRCRGCCSPGPRTRCVWCCTLPPSSPGSSGSLPPGTLRCCCRGLGRSSRSSPDRSSLGCTDMSPGHTPRDRSSPGDIHRWALGWSEPSARGSGGRRRRCRGRGTSGRCPGSSSPPSPRWAGWPASPSSWTWSPPTRRGCRWLSNWAPRSCEHTDLGYKMNEVLGYSAGVLGLFYTNPILTYRGSSGN